MYIRLPLTVTLVLPGMSITYSRNVSSKNVKSNMRPLLTPTDKLVEVGKWRRDWKDGYYLEDAR
jgi:hypothetical protein